jgi:hypothetical protein
MALGAPEPRPRFFDDLRQDLQALASESAAQSGRSQRQFFRQSWRGHGRVLLATAIVSAAVGGVIGASVSGAAGNPSAPVIKRAASNAPTFAPAEGWNTVTVSIMVRNDAAPVAWAANVPFAPEADYSGFPDRTVASLTSGGIVISVLGPRQVADNAPFPDVTERLALRAEDCATSYDGAPRPNIALCPLDRTLRPNEVINVQVWIATDGAGAKPDQNLIDEANAELARLALP